MKLQINGQPREVADDITVSALLQSLEIGKQRVAVARNGEVVPKASHAATVLQEGDKVEVVKMVGGG